MAKLLTRSTYISEIPGNIMPASRQRAGALLFALVLALAPIPLARASPAQTLAQSVAAWMRSNEIPSASLAVLDRGRPAGSYGFGGWSPTEPERVASLSKAITGVCIARLAQAGRLSFSDTLGTLLAPTFRLLGEPADPRFASITIAELLQHRSGLPRDVAPLRVVPNETLKERFRNVLRVRLAYRPGALMLYSNIGYLTLGMVVQAVTGEDYETACRQEALDPMGVSGSIDPILRSRAPNGGWLVSADFYARFLQVFAPQNTVLSPSMHEWLADQVGGYGMGAFVVRTRSGIALQHTGEVAGNLGGGSAYVTLANGWTAVIIFGGPTLGQSGYAALMRRMHAALGP